MMNVCGKNKEAPMCLFFLVRLVCTCKAQSVRNSVAIEFTQKAKRHDTRSVSWCHRHVGRCPTQASLGRIKKPSLLTWLFFLVRPVRLELTRSSHTPLKRTRLPIPPWPHIVLLLYDTEFSMSRNLHQIVNIFL